MPNFDTSLQLSAISLLGQEESTSTETADSPTGHTQSPASFSSATLPNETVHTAEEVASLTREIEEASQNIRREMLHWVPADTSFFGLDRPSLQTAMRRFHDYEVRDLLYQESPMFRMIPRQRLQVTIPEEAPEQAPEQAPTTTPTADAPTACGPMSKPKAKARNRRKRNLSVKGYACTWCDGPHLGKECSKRVSKPAAPIAPPATTPVRRGTAHGAVPPVPQHLYNRLCCCSDCIDFRLRPF